MPLVQSASNSTAKGAGRTCSATFTRPSASGSLLALVVSAAGGSPVSNAVPSGFVQAKSVGTPLLHLTVYYRENAPVTSKVTVTSPADRSLQVQVFEYSAVRQSAALDFAIGAVAPHNHTGSAIDTGTSAATAQADSTILTFVANTHASTTQFGFSGGFTRLSDTVSPSSNADADRSRLSAHHIGATASAAFRLRGSLSASRQWIAIMVAFKGGSAGPKQLVSMLSPSSITVGGTGGTALLSAFGPLRSTQPAAGVRTDSFTGTNGDPWPPAWTVDTGTLTIQGNAGRQVTAATASASAAGRRPGAANGELLVRWNWQTAGSERYTRVFARSTTGSTNYEFLVNATAAEIYLSTVAGGRILLATAAHATFATGAWHWIRARWQGSSLQMRVWTDGGVEPTTWTVTATDSTLADAGQVYLQSTTASGGGAQTTDFDDFVLRDLDSADTGSIIVGGAGGSARMDLFDYQYSLGPTGLIVGAGTDYDVVEHEGLEGWELRTSDDDLPRSDGALRGIDLQSARQILFEVELVGDLTNGVEAAVDELYRALTPRRDEDWPLQWRHPGRGVKQVWVRPTNLVRQLDHNGTVLTRQQFALRAADPRHYSVREHVVTVPVAAAGATTPATVSAPNVGNANAYPVIRMRGTTTDVSRVQLINGSADVTFDVAVPLTDGAVLLGDMPARVTSAPRSSITLDGASKYGAWQFPRVPFFLAPGDNQLYARTTPEGVAVTVTVTYHDTSSG